MRAIAASLLICVLSGCAGQQADTYTLRVDTEPTGATVVMAGNGASHVTPVSVYYTPTPQDLKNYTDAAGCVLSEGITAYWASGAAATTGGVVKFCGGAREQSIIIKRPANAPDIGKDHHAAALRQQQIRAEAANQPDPAGNILAAILVGAASGTISGLNARSRAPVPVRCSPGYAMPGQAPVYTCQ